MTSTQLHQPPGNGQVIREQFKSTALSLRVPALVAGFIGALATLLAIGDLMNGRGGVEFAPQLSLVPALAGLLLPIFVWQRERHFVAGFLWTLPVDRARQAFAKVFAAWLCLMIGAAAFVLWLLVLALITKGHISGDEMVRLLPTPADPPNGMIDASLLRTIQWIPQPALWLVPFTAATTAYVIMSGVMLGLRHPFRWIAGAVAGAFLIAAVAQGVDSNAFWNTTQGIIRPLMEGKYGIDAVLTARSETLHTRVALTSGKIVGVWRALPVVSDWIIATLLWTGLGTAGLCAALFRHRERR